MKFLVTGASGFIATHLVRRLLEEGRASVVAWSRQTQPNDLRADDRLTWRTVDMLDERDVDRAIADSTPDCVFHLAAQSLPKVSWEKPASTFDINVIGTLHLLNAMRRHAPKARLVLASSSAIYAPHPENLPIQEDHRLEGASLYAVSKMAQEMTARLWGENYGMSIVTVRPFFVIGPGKKDDVCSDLARRVVLAERSDAPEISVGNLSAVRDFLDIEDAVAALCLLADRGVAGAVYNLCRGSGWSIEEVLAYYRTLSSGTFQIKVDPSLLRPVDEPVKVGDPSKLRALGWEPTVAVELALAKIMDYWRAAEHEGP